MPSKKSTPKISENPLNTRIFESKKITSSSSPVFSYIIIIAVTVICMLFLEKFYNIPSSYLHTNRSSKIDNNAPLYEEVPIEGCTREFDPVCGINGRTYGNRCELDIARVTFAYKGECNYEASKKLQNEPVTTPENTGSLSKTGNTLSGEVSGSGGLKLQKYTNVQYDYELELPKYAYFRGYATNDKKGHTLAVDLKEELTSNFDTSMIRVRYIRLGDPIPTGANHSLSLPKGTLTITYTEPLSVKGKEIVDTIIASAKSID